MAFVDEELKKATIYSYGTCAICKGDVELMGRVESGRLVQEELRRPCDMRCTHALGPNCDCRCQGANHGSQALAMVIKDCGPVPFVVFASNKDARTVAEEWRNLAMELQTHITNIAKEREVVKRYTPEETKLYWKMHKKIEYLKKAQANRTHPARLRNLQTGIEL